VREVYSLAAPMEKITKASLNGACDGSDDRIVQRSFNNTRTREKKKEQNEKIG
jgi:hypothetical protein